VLKWTTIVDPQTGEVLRNKGKEFPPAFDEEKGYLFWNKKNFAKSFHEIEYPEEMNDLEVGRMARLAKKIWSNTNMLGYRGNGGIKPLTVEQMAVILKMKPRQAYKFIAKMISLGVMAKVKVETEKNVQIQYYINPIYFFSSNRLSLNLYLLFKDSLDAVIPAWAKREFEKQQAN
jgi:hypothetical protein